MATSKKKTSAKKAASKKKTKKTASKKAKKKTTASVTRKKAATRKTAASKKKASAKKKPTKKKATKKATSKKSTSKKTTSKTASKKKASPKKKSAAKTAPKKTTSKKAKQKSINTTVTESSPLRIIPRKTNGKKKKPVMRSTVKTSLSVGDIAVYPAHGVGQIERIENKEISGTIMTFYVMRILDSDMTVMIPQAALKSAGIREIITTSQVSKVFKIFEDQEVVIDTTTWNRRYREYMEKIKTGSVYEIAEVMRDLYVLKKTKTLSFGERKMLDTARSLLVKELAIAKTEKEEQIEEKIQSYFN